GEWAGLFELARLALHLPQYFEFMYDLVVTDSVPAGPDRHASLGAAPGRPQVRPVSTGPVFRIVKSIRVIRTATRPARQWTAPHFSFAVAGHWRRYRDPYAKGHDATGQVVLGRTWVHDYRKFRNKDLSPATATSASADPRVVINIKQSLAYARDVLSSAAATLSSPSPLLTQEGSSPGSTGSVGPTEEWMATERAKLTFQLRYLILRRDHFRCCVCGRSAASEPGVRLEVDHRMPVSDWGLTEESNLWTLCRECNRGKGTHALHLN
ncbi:MAG TPA: HNH endonuclease, partial [Terriglobia bacterium]|nr:HNH endonuclease [Terriglobia bacterium]